VLLICLGIAIELLASNDRSFALRFGLVSKFASKSVAKAILSLLNVVDSVLVYH